MLFFWRKSRRNKKSTMKRTTPRAELDDLIVSEKHDGYDPYDTMPGRPRDEFGMHRRDDLPGLGRGARRLDLRSHGRHASAVDAA